MTIREKAQEYAERIRRGETIRICGETYSDSAIRFKCSERQSYTAARWLSHTARTDAVRRESEEMAERIYDAVLFEQCLIAATDCCCGYHEEPHTVQLCAA